MSKGKALFNTFIDVPSSLVGLPNGTQNLATKEGIVLLSDPLTLYNVLFVLELTCNLICVTQLLPAMFYNITFTDKLCVIQDRNLRIPIGTGEQCDGIYLFKHPRRSQVNQTSMLSKCELWH